MANSFSKQLTYNRQSLLAVIVPELRKNGMHYEVNINGFPRFVMAWSALGRFDIIPDQPDVPYELLLGVSDILEGLKRRK